MIRVAWAGLVGLAGLLVLGTGVLLAALFRARGEVYMHITRAWTRMLLWASGVRVAAHGVEHVRPGTPAVIVSNHLSWFDIFATASLLPGTFHFVGKKELNRIPFFGTVWRLAGHISIDRSNREAAVASLRTAGEQIRREGSVVVIYPEGTRSRTGRLQPFKKGAFNLAVEAGVAVVPTVVTGSFEIMPPGSFRIRPRPVHVHFLPPIPAEEVRALGERGPEALMAHVRGIMLESLGEAEALPPAGENS